MGEEPVSGGEWLSITEAALRLTAEGDAVDRSTLSRYVSQHSEAIETRRDGKANLVEFGALAQHRRENIRLRRPAAASGAGFVPASAPATSRPGAMRVAGTQSDGLARKINADAEMREMDLAKRRAELTPSAEVDKAGRDAVALMLAAFDRAVETEAATLSVRYGWDERIARIALKGFARKGMEVFNRELRERLDQREREDFAAVAGEAEETVAALQ